MKRTRKLRKELMDFSFLLPSLFVFVLIILLPLIEGVQFTFTDWDGISATKHFVGFHNYITVFHDRDLLVPIRNTAIFTVVTVILVNAVGLGLALLVNHEFR